MGNLKHFFLKDFIDMYGLTTLFETGTMRGSGINYAKKFGFRQIVSSEIVPELAKLCQEKFKDDPRIKIHLGASYDVLREQLPNIQGNCLFWLDAHYPGEDGGFPDYNDPTKLREWLPLEEEISVIQEIRKGKGDVILIDDLRIYEDGPYQSGPETHRIPDAVRNLRFLDKPFYNTHRLVKIYDDEGYVLLLPRQSVNPTRKMQDMLKLRERFDLRNVE